jgi:hypothetical protein
MFFLNFFVFIFAMRNRPVAGKTGEIISAYCK